MLLGSIILMLLGVVFTVWGTNTQNPKWLFAAAVGLLWIVTGIMGVFFVLF